MLRKAIILSAGQGRRLLPLTENTPKCLLPVSGKPVVAWQVDALLAAGIDEIVVVGGFQVEQVEKLLSERYLDAPGVKVKFNPFYEVADNLASCWIVRQEMNTDFLLLNGDTLIDSELLARILNDDVSPITLCVDFKDEFDEDDMKVQLGANGEVKQVSKKLPAIETDAESIGLIRFSKEGARVFHAAIEKALRDPANLNSWYLAIINRLAGLGMVGSHPVTGCRWCEIDYLHDLQQAREYFLQEEQPLKGQGAVECGVHHSTAKS